LQAIIRARTPLYYAEGADESLDRPAHIRAGSSLASTRNGVALVQDDANFIAIVDPATGRARAITLPAGEGGKRQFDRVRGNKKYKFDLEACVSSDQSDGTLLVALASGSKQRRDAVVTIRACESDDPLLRLTHAPLLFAALRETEAFAGSQMNIEGAIIVGENLRLFSRGNGKARGGLEPVNATCDLDWQRFLQHVDAPETQPPKPTNVKRYDLDALDGVALGFTDAALLPDGRTIYSAAAESSPDVVEDGPVHGSAIGVIDRDGRTRWAPVTEATGQVFDGKIEGVLPVPGRADSLLVVVDADAPDTPSLLCTIELRGDW
jgi:hypothetical protein